MNDGANYLYAAAVPGAPAVDGPVLAAQRPKLSRMPLREFANCWERIGRADHHRRAFAKAWSDFLADEPYDANLHIEQDGTGELSFACRYDPLPSVFAFELGEMLYHLRAALDAAVYAAAVLETGRNPPPNERDLEFPVCMSAAAFPKVARRKVAPLTRDRRWIVECMQPFNMPGGVSDERKVYCLNRALAMLHDWARKDRHRKLHVVGSWASHANPAWDIPEPASLSYYMVTHDGFLEHDSLIAAFKIDDYVPGMNVRANPHTAVDVAVIEDPPPCADNDTLGARMDSMMAVVRVIVKVMEESLLHERSGGGKRARRQSDGT
jgi:hypothetical protein